MSQARSTSDPPTSAPSRDDVRWLTEDEQQVWRGFIESVSLLTETLDRQLQRDSGIPHSYYEILVRLSETEGRRIRMSQLADSLLSSRSRLSHAVRRLEDLGWVERQACPDDKRGQLAVLTEAGWQALVAAAPGHVTAVREHVFDPLRPEQVEQLGEIARALLDRMGGSTGDPDA